jgi:hypothetical protein
MPLATVCICDDERLAAQGLSASAVTNGQTCKRCQFLLPLVFRVSGDLSVAGAAEPDSEAVFGAAGPPSQRGERPEQDVGRHIQVPAAAQVGWAARGEPLQPWVGFRRA